MLRSLWNRYGGPINRGCARSIGTYGFPSNERMLLLATLRVRSLGLHVLLGRRGSLLCRISNILACLLYSRGSLLCRISNILACLLYSRGSLLSQITETTASLFYLIGGLL